MDRFWNNYRWFRLLAWWVALPLLVLTVYYNLKYPTCTFRYRLTAEVMTPDGLKTGSSVVEVSYRSGPRILGMEGLDLRARGEAPFVRLDDRRLFFVSLTGEEAGRGPPQFRSYTDTPSFMRGVLDVHALPLKAFGLSWEKLDERRLCRQVATAWDEKRKVAAPFANLPTLVVFTDVNDPDSARVVQPDSIASVLGEGYALQNVWLELTQGRPTSTGMSVFPWWDAKLEEQKTINSFGQGQTLINNILDDGFRRPGIWDDNK